MTISNIGDEAQSMFGDNQQAFDAKNRKFSASTEAAIYDPKSEVLFEEINPGNSVEARVYSTSPRRRSSSSSSCTTHGLISEQLKFEGYTSKQAVHGADSRGPGTRPTR